MVKHNIICGVRKVELKTQENCQSEMTKCQHPEIRNSTRKTCKCSVADPRQ